MKRSAKLTYSNPDQGIRDLAGISNQIVKELPFHAPITITADHSADGTYRVIIADTTGGNVTIDLPSASSIDGSFTILRKTAGGNTLTINPHGSETINGSATDTLAGAWNAMVIVPDGSNWVIVSEK